MLMLNVAAKCSPSVIKEMRDCRANIGEKAKFSLQYAGNPKPGIFNYTIYNNKK